MRTILHSDLNNFFASVEMLSAPELKNLPMAVCGNAEERKGIVLAKNELAKKVGIKTGMTIWEAKRLCPNLQTVDAHMEKYVEYSFKVLAIYARFTDLVESFGIDEAWLDVTHSAILFGDGETIANEIKTAIKAETGLTVSIGVSFNKVFAKLASDMKKPDAITVIPFDKYKETIWKLPVENLLFVGKASLPVLKKMNIFTIGDCALCDYNKLNKVFGKAGITLWKYARGEDDSEVRKYGDSGIIKSVSNSTTCKYDLYNDEQVLSVFFELSELIATRAIKYKTGKPKTVLIWIRDSSLESFTRQAKLDYPTLLIEDICQESYKLFKANYAWENNIRSLGIAISDFQNRDFDTANFTVAGNIEKLEKRENLQACVTNIKEQYGKEILKRGTTLRKEFQDEKVKEHVQE